MAVPALGLAAKRHTAPNAYDLTSVARAEALDNGTLPKTASRLLARAPRGRSAVYRALLVAPAGDDDARGDCRAQWLRPTAAAERRAPHTAEDAGRKLAELLKVSGLPGLRVSAAAGQVVVTGSIMKEQTAAWTEAQQWFDPPIAGGWF